MQTVPLEDRIQVRHRALARAISFELVDRLALPIRTIPGKTACVALAYPPAESKGGVMLPDESQGMLRQDHGFLLNAWDERYTAAQALVRPYDGLWFEVSYSPYHQYRLYGTVETVTLSIPLVVPAERDEERLCYTYPAVSSEGVDWSMALPTGDNVLMKSGKTPEKAPGSDIYLPEIAANAPVEAEVVAIGPDVKHVKVGERVIFSPRLTIKLEEDGEMRYLLASEEAIYAVVEGEL